VQLRDAPSLVLAVYPGAIETGELPFVRVARLLAAMPIPVPTIVSSSDALGILALEDLGDVTLQQHLCEATPDDRRRLYREAVTLIGTMQRRGRELASDDFVPYGLAFDVAKLTAELQFFTTHFLEACRGAALTERARAALTREYAAIVDELAAEPRVVCHRDYHSRNLMLHRGRLYVIDFQDARMGPDTYDLASLLRDSYVDFTSEETESLIEWFLLQRRAGASDDHDFRRRFDLMAVQRNLKALGTFGFQATSRRNESYLQYVPRTLAHVRANLERYPRFAALRAVLAEYLVELR
jgi:aminoglycoside/choline kinase family phosphotransferase